MGGSRWDGVSRIQDSGFGIQASGVRQGPKPGASSEAPMKWTDAEDIGIALLERYPTKDPLSARFTELRDWVVGLAGFDDDPAGATEGRLEAIQMAWYEEWQDREP